MSSTAEVDEDGELTNYKVDCMIAFVVESADEAAGSEHAAAARRAP